MALSQSILSRLKTIQNEFYIFLFDNEYLFFILAKVGTQIIVPYRGVEDDVRYLRLMGDLGQIVFVVS